MMDGTFIEALDKVSREAATKTVVLEGREYSTSRLHRPELVGDPVPKHLEVRTLDAVISYVNSRLDGEYTDERGIFVHVAGPKLVRVNTAVFGEKNQRVTLLASSLYSECGFLFSEYLPQEEFLIGLMTGFVRSGDFGRVMKTVSALQNRRVSEGRDDGLSQAVVVRSGAASVSAEVVKNPVMLSPYRTFGEVDQPASPFILRFSGGDENSIPMIGLFPVVSQAWRLEATESIREYIENGLKPSVLVLA